MKEIQKALPVVLIILVFLFWLFLGMGNYFHWDEWLMFILSSKSLSGILTINYGQHYIPINLIYYWSFIRIFGLNYFPYQVVVAFLQAVNSLLLFFIVLKETKKKWLAIMAMTVFGFSNVGIENLVWSLGMNYLGASLLLNLGYLLFLKFEERQRVNYVIISAIFLFISPLFHNITFLMPLALTLLYLFSPFIKSRRFVFFYLAVQFLLILLILHFSGMEISSNVKFSFSRILQITSFIGVGIVRGTITRFVLPGAHFVRGATITSSLVFILGTFGPLVLIIFATIKYLLNEKFCWRKIYPLIRYPFLMIFLYLSAALARSSTDLGAPGISRYAYPAFFFGMIFISLILNEIVKNSRTKLIVIAGAIFFLCLNLNANINFNRNFWSKLVSRDRKFVSEVRRIFQNNSTIVDINPKGIWPTMKLSQMWFLFPAGKKLNFVDPTTISMGEQYHDLLTEFQMKGD